MNRQDFETGLILSLVSPPVPHVVKKVDRLDNEWPIEWTLRGTANNKEYTQSMMRLRRISDAVIYDYEKAAVAVTVLPDSGGEVVFTTRNIGATEWELGVLITIQCTYNGSSYFLVLLVAEKAGTSGIVEFDKGTYYAFMDGSYQSITFSNADVRFEMTAPLPTSYSYNGVILPALPEWKTDVYPYAVIYSSAVFGIVSDGYTLMVASAPLFASGGSNNALKSTDAVTYRRCSYDAETETWKQLGDEVTGTFDQTCVVRWANYNVLKSDGSVYLAASDPVPIYE